MGLGALGSEVVMDEIPKNLEKELSQLSKAKTRKKAKRWTLLFVNDRGRIRAFRYFKGLMFFSMLLFFSAIAFSVVVYLLYEESVRENFFLKEDLKISKQKVKVLLRDKEKLTAQLIIVESRIEAMLQKAEPARDEEGSFDSEALVVEKKEAEPPGSVTLADPIEPVIPEMPAVAPVETLPEPKPSAVDVDEFRISRNVEHNQFEVQFKIKNNNPGSKQVSGYSFVLLRGEETDPENWFVFPEVEMVSGKPAQIKNGRHFSISRFKTVKLNTQGRILEASIHSAIVMVFDKKGELMLEKSFPINEKKVTP